MSAPADPLGVECPRCGTDPGEPCLTPRGEDATRPHKARQEHADKVAAAAIARAEGDAVHRIENVRMRRIYVACRLELEQRGAWTKLAAAELEDLVHKLELGETSRDAAASEPFVAGSMGQLVPHPGHALAVRYGDAALKLAKALKVTPDTRGTSAPVPEDDTVEARAGEADSPDAAAEERDELSAIDELALARKRKASSRRK
jgi:hypothetical protein